MSEAAADAADAASWMPALSTARHPGADPAEWADFVTRVTREAPRLTRLLNEIYGESASHTLEALIIQLAESWQQRPPALRELDTARLAAPDWFQSNQMLGGVCYVDRYATDLEGVVGRIPYFTELGLTYLHLMPLFAAPDDNSDGGYAVSSYRSVSPALGDLQQLANLAAKLRANDIVLVLDFIFNHTSNEHEWAQRAIAGETEFENYYRIFDGREQPDAYEQTVREIFPDDHAGAFVPFPHPDGTSPNRQQAKRWIWATFYHFQWDLNYANPAVLRAMAGEMLFLANQGIDVLRMDAVAFIWKRMGTTCENLPEAHLLIQAFNAMLRIAAPSVLFKSEAIVHPDQVIEYISLDECQLSYNPLQMALIWSSLATRDAQLLQQALDRRHTLPTGTAWVNYVRSHDDIGWTFSDDDAAELGIDGFDHRRFLNSFYVGRFAGSFARGIPFQDNPETGDCRISGTTASLAGLEAGDVHASARILLAHSIVLSTGGIPLLYLGDEVGQLNDPHWADEPGHADDSRWTHRPRYPGAEYARRNDAATDAGRIFAGLQHMLAVRRSAPEFSGGTLLGFDTKNPHVLGYQRPDVSGSLNSLVVCFANFAEDPQLVTSLTLSGLPPFAIDLLTDARHDLRADLTLPAHGVVWLRV
jgi:amylosucrase